MATSDKIFRASVAFMLIVVYFFLSWNYIGFEQSPVYFPVH